MSFGKNPHVPKAEAAEQKARVASDVAACAMAWRDAARQWDRAAEREVEAGRKAVYTERAEAARRIADSPDPLSASEQADDEELDRNAPIGAKAKRDPSLLN